MSIFSTAFNPSTSDANTVLRNVPCDSSVAIGDVVRVEGGIIVKAIADNFEDANILGVCEEKASATLCSVRVSGVTAPIYSGLNEGLDYYLSPFVAGALTTTAPTLSGQILIRVGQPFDADRLTVIKGTRIQRA